MSRKRRNRGSVGKVAQNQVKSTLSADAQAQVGQDPNMSAADGYVNSLAYLGEASALNRANDYERHSISTDYNLLTVLYRENWLAARIIDTPCEDMTRSWYSISTELEQEKLDELAKLEAKHSIKQEITNAIRWGRLYGGAAAVMVIKGQEDMLNEPLDYDMLQPGCFRGLIVIDKIRGIYPSIELEEDMDDPEFGYPKWYQVTLDEESGEIIEIHHSRLLLFRGRQLPIDEEVNADYWGASELEHIYEELQKRNSSSANIAQLIFQANVAAIKIADYGEVLGMGTAQQRQQVYRTMEEMNRLRTSFGVTLMGTDDDYEQHPYSFAGVAEVYETFMMDMAGASEIPATKLFGRAPQGMNATGESDMKNYYEVISQLQERILKPALEKLLPVMCMSLWGEVPEDMEIVFEPLGTTTPSERAEIMGQFATPIIQAFSAGLISQKLALQELRETGKPINAWTNISDEDIENAEDEVDQGEMMGDPMGGMMGGDPGGQMPPEEMPPEGGEMPPEGQVQPEVDMDKVHELKERIHGLREAQEQPEIDMDKVHELKERVHNLRSKEETQAEPEIDLEKVHELKERLGRLRETQEGLESGDENQARLEKIKELKERIARIRENAESTEDGGPGSGPRPGYHKNGSEIPQNQPEAPKKASLVQRAKFLLNPTRGKQYTGKAPSAAQAKREHEQWTNLSAGQKIRGQAEQNRHVAKVKREVVKAAMEGNIAKAKQIVNQNRHYWSNTSEAAMKEQSEALKRQKAVPKTSGRFLGRLFSRHSATEDGGPGSGNHHHAGRPGQKGGSAPSGGGSGGANREPVDNGPGAAYNGHATKGWSGLKAAMEVGGPKAARKYISKYMKKHPEVAKDVEKYMGVRTMVRDFLKNNPNAENFQTYDAETGEVKPITSGFCVTFHQNNTETDPLGGYSDEDYAALCAIAVRELGAKGVNIGYYGNPEVSFECQDEKTAKEFAVRHNQQSIYNASTGRTLKNKKYRQDLNPIRL